MLLLVVLVALCATAAADAEVNTAASEFDLPVAAAPLAGAAGGADAAAAEAPPAAAAAAASAAAAAAKLPAAAAPLSMMAALAAADWTFPAVVLLASIALLGYYVVGARQNDAIASGASAQRASVLAALVAPAPITV